jgi:uncharacterized protein YhfF
MWERREGLRTLALADPGPVRQLLADLIVAGKKTATAQYVVNDYALAGEQPHQIGERLAVLDDADSIVAYVRVTRVEFVPFADVKPDFIAAEGEDFDGHAGWAAIHGPFFESKGHVVEPSTPVVCLEFELER